MRPEESAGASPELSLVIPVYNEAVLLEKVVAALESDLKTVVPSFEIILSENGSRDGSAALVDRLTERFPAVRALHDPVADYGFALKRGLLAARGRLMANFSVDFVDIPFLKAALPRMGEADIILGSKHLEAGSDQRTWVRRYGGRTFHATVQMLFGLPVRDTHGIKIFRRERVTPFIERCEYGGALFDTELILRCHRAGLSLREVPVSVRETRPSRKGIARLAVSSLAGLLRMRAILLREELLGK